MHPAPAERPRRSREASVTTEIVQRLRTARTQRQLTQQTLASRLGISREAISRYESGERDMHIATLIDLSRVLGCPPADTPRSVPWPIYLLSRTRKAGSGRRPPRSTSAPRTRRPAAACC